MAQNIGENEPAPALPIADARTYLSKIAEKTGISGKTQGTAIQILIDARRKRAAAGKDPMGLAAAALSLHVYRTARKRHKKTLLKQLESQK